MEPPPSPQLRVGGFCHGDRRLQHLGRAYLPSGDQRSQAHGVVPPVILHLHHRCATPWPADATAPEDPRSRAATLRAGSNVPGTAHNTHAM
jgi:hypothetical protein